MDDFVHVDTSVLIEQHASKPDMASPNQVQDSDEWVTFLNRHPFVRQVAVDKIHGCLFGSALGDTVGLYTEFLTKVQSAKIYPDGAFSLVNPVTESYQDQHRACFSDCAWTDDTDQALLIVLSYLHAYTSTPQTLSLDELAQDFASRLKIWITQGLLALDRFPCGIGALVSGVVNSQDYLSNPLLAATRRWVNSGRYQAPNGSLMRTHPIGVIGVNMSEEHTIQMSVSIGRTTHVDPRCVVACCIQVALIRGVIRGDIRDEQDLDSCIERCYRWVKCQPELMNPGLDQELTKFEIERHLQREEFEKHVYVKSLAELHLDEPGKIGYVYKCLGSAIFSLRSAMRAMVDGAAGQQPLAAKTMFESLMTDLILEGGDADTNGAAAGAILGAYVGHAALPSHWTMGLAHKEWLVQKTGRLAVASHIIKDNLPPEKDESSDGGVGLRTNNELDHRWALFIAAISSKMNAAKEKERERAKKEGERYKAITRWLSR